MIRFRSTARQLLMASVASISLSAPGGFAFAQDAETTTTGAPDTTTVESLIVTPNITFRNRTSDENPVLSYDQEYFQRFEPVSVGEMLKRVPGVTFTSDVLEFDGVSMRGLPPGYTNVTINGRRAPGGEQDGAFLVDRIPAELVERIEIVRSPRADEPSDGMAGTLNIVLREGATLRGGFAKAGVLLNEDGGTRGSAAVAYAGGDEETSWWGALNYQGRRNPKQKVSLRYNGDFGGFDNTELQADTRDGVDLSANGEVTHYWDMGRFRLNALVIDTDRDEDETSLTYDDLDLTSFDEAEIQAERIGQRTYALAFDTRLDAMGGQWDFDLGWTAYKEDTVTSVFVTDEEDLTDQELDEYVELNIDDEEWAGGLDYTRRGMGWRLKVGVDLLEKQRAFSEVEFDIVGNLPDDPDPEPGAIHTIDESRIDPYVRLTLTPNDQWTVDLGVRFENTDREVTSDLGRVSFSDSNLNPSMHVTWKPSEVDQFRFSAAQTVRRPDYNLLAPFFADEEPADDDGLRGNPLLRNETAWGYDLGYERRLGDRGVFGINVFHRSIDDLIELVDTGTEVNEDGETPGPGDDLFNLYEPRNIGDGKTWGVEVDFSSPLDFVGLPNTGIFFNYTWLDSEVRDPFTGERRPFLNQPSHVYNIGFIHTLEAQGMSFGASLYDRDMGYETGLDEIATVDYDGDLEAFVEKRFGERVVVRLSAMNLLDKEKRETYRTFDGDSVEEILDNRVNGNVDESERESERSGVLYQVTVRSTF